MSRIRLQKAIEAPLSDRAVQMIRDHLTIIEPGIELHIDAPDRGVWFVSTNKDRGILMAPEAAEHLLSPEARQLGEELPYGLVFFLENKNLTPALVDSRKLATSWYDYSGIEPDQWDEFDSALMLDAAVYFPRYFEPVGRNLETTHGKQLHPQDERIAQRMRHIKELRELNHPGLIKHFYPSSDVIDRNGHWEPYGYAQTLDDRFFPILEKDFKPEEGFLKIEDYPNHINLRNSRQETNEPRWYGQQWALYKMLSLFGSPAEMDKSVLLDDAPALSMNTQEIEGLFADLGCELARKSLCPINWRQVDYIKYRDAEEKRIGIPETVGFQNLAVADLIDSAHKEIMEVLQAYVDMGRISLELGSRAFKSFQEGLESTEINNTYLEGKYFDQFVSKGTMESAFTYRLKHPITAYACGLLDTKGQKQLEQRIAELTARSDDEDDPYTGDFEMVSAQAAREVAGDEPVRAYYEMLRDDPPVRDELAVSTHNPLQPASLLDEYLTFYQPSYDAEHQPDLVNVSELRNLKSEEEVKTESGECQHGKTDAERVPLVPTTPVPNSDGGADCKENKENPESYSSGSPAIPSVPMVPSPVLTA